MLVAEADYVIGSMCVLNYFLLAKYLQSYEQIFMKFFLECWDMDGGDSDWDPS